MDLNVKVDGSTETITLRIGADLKLGGSRKGNIYAILDMKLHGDTVGVGAMIGLTLN